jgi:hypothetical protein
MGSLWSFLAKPKNRQILAWLGKLGGAARARKLTPEQRAEIARKGARSGGGRRLGKIKLQLTAKPLGDLALIS